MAEVKNTKGKTEEVKQKSDFVTVKWIDEQEHKKAGSTEKMHVSTANALKEHGLVEIVK